MKYCSKCGKEIMDEAVVCPGCGCAVENKKAAATNQTYEQAIQCSSACGVISTILFVLGVVVALFINVVIGAVLCLAAEIVALIPNTRVQKLFKRNNSHITDKKALKAAEKALRKELKQKNKAYAFTSVVSIIALIGVIVFALLM